MIGARPPSPIGAIGAIRAIARCTRLKSLNDLGVCNRCNHPVLHLLEFAFVFKCVQRAIGAPLRGGAALHRAPQGAGVAGRQRPAAGPFFRSTVDHQDTLSKNAGSFPVPNLCGGARGMRSPEYECFFWSPGRSPGVHP